MTEDRSIIIARLLETLQFYIYLKEFPQDGDIDQTFDRIKELLKQIDG